MCCRLEAKHGNNQNNGRAKSRAWLLLDYVLVCVCFQDPFAVNLTLHCSVALTLFRIDALRWTPHMDENLQVLMDAKECPEDEILVTLVKIQLVMDKVHHHRRDSDGQLPSLIYTKSFQAQLDSVRSQIPQHLKQQSMHDPPTPTDETKAQQLTILQILCCFISVPLKSSSMSLLLKTYLIRIHLSSIDWKVSAHAFTRSNLGLMFGSLYQARITWVCHSPCISSTQELWLLCTDCLY